MASCCESHEIENNQNKESKKMARKGSIKRVTPEWAKHLRKFGKKSANKAERQSAKIKIK